MVNAAWEVPVREYVLPLLEEQQQASQPPQQLLAGHPPQLGQRVAAKNEQEEVKNEWLNQCLGRFLIYPKYFYRQDLSYLRIFGQLWSRIRSKNINYVWAKMSYSILKKCCFQRYKLENARFIKTEYYVSGLDSRGLVARLLVWWHLKQRIRIQKASKKTMPKDELS